MSWIVSQNTTLIALLCELFSEEELRRFIRERPEDQELLQHLPTQTSQHQMAEIAVSWWRRRGLPLEKLIARLLDARPHQRARIAQFGIPPTSRWCVLPPDPAMLTGRNALVADVLRDLSVPERGPILALQGLPGIGKTVLSATIARHPGAQAAFPGGVLWGALGTDGRLLDTLTSWGREISDSSLLVATDAAQAVSHLQRLLHTRTVLLVLDDVWAQEPVALLRRAISGHSRLLITTREPRIVSPAIRRPEDLIAVPLLSIQDSIRLLIQEGGTGLQAHLQAARALAEALEGLPLALRVAGRLIREEVLAGEEPVALMQRLRSGLEVLDATAPADRADPKTGTLPRVAALLQSSTDRLPPDLREKLALLGLFAAQPATFSQKAVAAAWRSTNPQPGLKALQSRGLLDQRDGRWSMHALIAVHARTLLDGL